MQPLSSTLPGLDKPVRFSYAFMAVTLVLVGWLHLGAALIAALFAYLALSKLQLPNRRGQILAIILFVCPFTYFGDIIIFIDISDQL